MESNPRAVIGGNIPPEPEKIDRTFKKRWAMALFARPDKPAGAVAMAFKLYMEMDGQGRGATISDAEFQVACGVSDGSCRNFKRWLFNQGFIQILRRGYRGHRSEFLATIPGEGIPASAAANEEAEYRQPLPARESNLPASTAAIEELAANAAGSAPRVPARIEPPSGVNNTNINNQLASVESNSARGLAGLNGSAEPMIADIRVWMVGGDDRSARQWLATMLSQYPQEVIRNAYVKLKTDLASGSLVAKPLQTWARIAQRMGEEPKQAKAGATSGPTRRDRIRQYIEEAQAKKEPRQRHEQ